MPKTERLHLLILLAAILVLTAAYLGGVAGVPFHPDESTRLFTSGDAELFLRQPSAVFWRAENQGDLRQGYRELDSPLPNLLIAISRWIAGEPPLANDWDWGKTWRENEQAGALPTERQLLAGRAASAVFYPFTLLFFFLAVRQVANRFTAWTAMLLLASNALVLLHTRRSMAEGALLFTTALTLWSLVSIKNERWLISLPAALAFCAKQTLAPLLPVGLAAALWTTRRQPSEPARRLARNALLFSAAALGVIVLLHPFLWGQPVKAIRAAVGARQALAAAQTTDRPEQALNTPARRLVGMVSLLYLTPPMVAEAGNYAEETRFAVQAYLATPLHTLFRSVPAGAALLVLSLFGFISAVLRASKDDRARRGLTLFLSITLLQIAALFLLVPLPWQRYYLPLVLYACLWTAFGIDQLRLAVLRSARVKAQAQPGE